jgi:hypothetical protein
MWPREVIVRLQGGSWRTSGPQLIIIVAKAYALSSSKSSYRKDRRGASDG